jgi:hypothetical protein
MVGLRPIHTVFLGNKQGYNRPPPTEAAVKQVATKAPCSNPEPDDWPVQRSNDNENNRASGDESEASSAGEHPSDHWHVRPFASFLLHAG